MIPTFNDLEKEAFLKHCMNRRKCWLPSFSPLTTMFSRPPKTFNFSLPFILLSANAFNLDQSKNLLFGKELKRILPQDCYTCGKWLIQDSTKLWFWKRVNTWNKSPTNTCILLLGEKKS